MNVKKILIIVILAIIITLKFNNNNNVVLAYEEYIDAKEVFQDYGIDTQSTDKSLNKSLKKFLKTKQNKKSGHTESVDIGGKTYWYNPEDEEEILNIGNKLARDEIYAKNNEDSLRRFNDSTNDKNIETDSSKAIYILNGLTDAITVVLGFLITIISIGTVLLSGIDIAYMVFPIFRHKINNSSLFKAKDADNKIRFISDDAQYAVMKSETSGDGTSPLIFYLKGRVITYMILAVLLYLLLSGSLYKIATVAIKLAGGIINVLAEAIFI